MTSEILICHSNWVGKCYFDIQNPILTFELSQKIVFWHSKSYFDIRTESEYLFWHWKSYLTFELSRKIVFWQSKFYFDIRTESEKTFKILFWHSNWVGKCYFDIQNPILTFELSRKMLFWSSKSYFDIRTESENVFWYSKSYFDIRTESENDILIFHILFWFKTCVGKWYFDIQNPILTFQNRILSWKIVFWHSTFELSRKMLFDIQNPIFDIRTVSENRIFSKSYFDIQLIGKCYFDI